ncbi:MAG TPA: hypothetical protein VLE91_03475, partial [Candidatus Saccharimonadales bacterium]|nr:hypothetical protein [Candidatus Saccharimonadales bacterium]
MDLSRFAAKAAILIIVVSLADLLYLNYLVVGQRAGANEQNSGTPTTMAQIVVASPTLAPSPSVNSIVQASPSTQHQNDAGQATTVV